LIAKPIEQHRLILWLDPQHRLGSLASGQGLAFGLEALSEFVTKGELDEAIAAYRQAIVLKPEEASVHFGLGFLLARNERSDEAISAFRDALARAPNYAEAQLHLARALAKKEAFDEAIAAYRKAELRRGCDRTCTCFKSRRGWFEFHAAD
jgi:tetratricopeptide (TPR) repeat protein